MLESKHPAFVCAPDRTAIQAGGPSRPHATNRSVFRASVVQESREGSLQSLQTAGSGGQTCKVPDDPARDLQDGSASHCSKLHLDNTDRILIKNVALDLR